jgi:hypothetical protein
VSKEERQGSKPVSWNPDQMCCTRSLPMADRGRKSHGVGNQKSAQLGRPCARQESGWAVGQLHVLLPLASQCYLHLHTDYLTSSEHRFFLHWKGQSRDSIPHALPGGMGAAGLGQLWERQGSAGSSECRMLRKEVGSSLSNPAGKMTHPKRPQRVI